MSRIVQGSNWCIFVIDDASSYSNLGFIIVNFERDIYDRVRVRIDNCEVDPYLVHFSNNGIKDMISLVADPGFCVTNQGDNPNNSDVILLKHCRDNNRFFTFRAEDLPSSSTPIEVPVTSTPTTFDPMLAPSSAPSYRNRLMTLVFRLEIQTLMMTSQRLMQNNCGDEGPALQQDGNLIRIQLNNRKCMQAGCHMVSPRQVTNMHIYDFDESKSRQK